MVFTCGVWPSKWTSDMRVLITGANGQLGQELQRVCAAAGDDVVALTKAQLDVANREDVLQHLGAIVADVVLHTAAWTNVDGCELDPTRAYEINAMGCRHVAEAAALTGSRVVGVSTDYVFNGAGTGPTGGGPYNEWDSTAPVSHYGRSKLGGEEELATLLGPDATIVRTSWVCGEFGSNFVKTMLRLATDGAAESKVVTVVDDQHGTPTFTPHLAATIRSLAVSRLPGLFHVSNADPTTWFHVAQAVFEAAGQNPQRVHPVSTAELLPSRPAPRPAYSVLDNAALRAVGLPALGDWQEPLAELVAALRK